MAYYAEWIRANIRTINRLVEKEGIRNFEELAGVIGRGLGREINKRVLDEEFRAVTGQTLKKYLREVNDLEKKGFREFLEGERRKKDAEREEIEISAAMDGVDFSGGRHIGELGPKRVYRVLGINGYDYTEDYR